MRRLPKINLTQRCCDVEDAYCNDNEQCGGDSDDDEEEEDDDIKEDDDSDDFCTGKPTQAVEPNLLSDASSAQMPDPIVLPLLPKIIFVVAIMTTMK